MPRSDLTPWIARVALLALLVAGTWVVVQPELNLAHYTPNRLMRRLGLPYEAILAYEHYLQWVLHVIVALALTMLLYASQLIDAGSRWIGVALPATAVTVLAICAEIVQLFIGRGFELADVLFSIAGAATGAGLLLLMTHRRPGGKSQKSKTEPGLPDNSRRKA